MKNLVILFVGVFLPMIGVCQYKALHKDMDQLTEEWFDDDAPGGVIIIVKGDEIIYSKIGGIADMGTGLAIDDQTIFNTGSISKTFVASAILMLHEQGKLNIDDPISMYFDDFDDESIAEAVTVKNLLSHTSGLPDLRDVRGNVEFYMTAKDVENFAPLKATKEFDFEPGSQFQYSNPAYNGLALIVEQVSGQKWQDFIEENIFEPAGMEQSTITDGAHPETGVAHAYVEDNGEYKEYDYGEFPTFTASGNGGVWCSIGDLILYEKALHAGKIISKELFAESRTPYHPDNWSSSSPPGVGYGWWVQENNDQVGGKIEYHTGSQGGFRAFHIYIPGKDILYCALFNRPVDTRGLFEKGLKVIGKLD